MPVSASKIYSLLLNHFGSQGWWPTAPQGKSKPVYHPKPKVKKLTESEQFEVCVGAILTQNTAWSNVEKALIELYRHRLMSPQKILKIPSPKLQQLIHSSGYFRQKTKKLKFFCNYLIKNYSGKVSQMLKKPATVLREELLGLYGMGPETVDSILLYAGGKPVFVVDAYTRRIGNRVGLFRTEDYSEIQHFFHRSLKPSAKMSFLPKQESSHSSVASIYNDYHALLVALGKNFCRKNPLCEKCPLKKSCNFYRRKSPELWG